MAAAAQGTLYLVDASLYIFRAWFSLPPSEGGGSARSAEGVFTNADGHSTNAVYGFAGFLVGLLERTRASHVALCFDESLTTSFRSEIYPQYKANREPAPEELKRQFAWCRAFGEGLGVACFSDRRYEADDLIGTLARSRPEGFKVSIVSADKDLTQLLQPGDEMWDFSRNKRLDCDGVRRRFGVGPEQIADFLALAGDAVDNIPGIPGVGPKTAGALLAHFGDLESVLTQCDAIATLPIRGASGIARRVRDHAEDARLSRRLTEVMVAAECITPPVKLTRDKPDLDGLNALFDQLGFGQMLRRRCGKLSRLPDEV